ncbi:MAG: serine/threonine protein kinase, partial [Chloroflexi bacterium]|nr:serine/threonine protein kinase [Chloroflexota bacterium]
MSEETTFGKYQILKELGRGGFGIVYLARDIMLHREVALKVLYSQHSIDTDFIQRFEQEARLAATIDHPNIVPVYDFNQLDGRYFIAMGLMSGGSLKDKLRQHGIFDSELARNIFLQIVEGVSYMHQRGLVHRDIKPSNILFDHRGIARIGDFGFTRSVQPDANRSLTMTGVL